MTIFQNHFTMQGRKSHSSFLTWIKVIFWDGRRLAHLLGQVVRLLRHGARRTGERVPCLGITRRQLRTPRPAPAGGCEVKMVGYITISSGTAQWLSKKWCHVACISVVITFCTSPFCVGVSAFRLLSSLALSRAWEQVFSPFFRFAFSIFPGFSSALYFPCP